MNQVIVRHGFNWLAGFAPCAQAANNYERIEALFPQQVRHPGARNFAYSSTVDVNVFVLG